MPEPPDFDQIAASLLAVPGSDPQAEIVTALRYVWNARGAADAKAIEATMRDICPDCDGRGEVLDAPDRVLDGRAYWTVCPTCQGAAKHLREAIVALDVTPIAKA